MSMFDKPYAIPAVALAAGKIAGARVERMIGRNGAVTTAEDVWSSGGDWAAPATAEVVNLVSADAADDAAGTGARTILVEGTNDQYALDSETVTMDGVTPVPTVKKFWNIHRMTIATAGSGGTNAGLITATSAAAGTPIIDSMSAGASHSRSSIFLVPDGYTAYVPHFAIENDNGTANSSVRVALFAKTPTGVWVPHMGGTITNTGSSHKVFKPSVAGVFTARTWLKARVTVISGGSAFVAANYEIILLPGA